jgi:dTDP-4-amino-4,6-dideoxygalactose transaminase
MTVAGSQKLSVPLLNLCRQYDNIKEELDLAIQKVIKTQSFILGEEVRTLEHDIAQYCGTKYAVGVNSGTDALFLALKVLGIKEGDEVITVPFTFIATAEAITNVGAKPVFVDIDPKTFNMDPSAIEAKITKKQKAIIPVHLYGQCADMDCILDIARNIS